MEMHLRMERRSVVLDTVIGGRTALAAGWSCGHLHPRFSETAGHVAVYAGQIDGHRVDGERVIPQPGGLYGVPVTADVIGPFKGEPGRPGWQAAVTIRGFLTGMG